VDASFALTALERLTAEETAELCDWAAVASARRAISSVWCVLLYMPTKRTFETVDSDSAI
jgi:hypothetical protein